MKKRLYDNQWTPQLTYEQVAAIMSYHGDHITRQRVQQIERLALAKMRIALAGYSDNPNERAEADAEFVVLRSKPSAAKAEYRAKRPKAFILPLATRQALLMAGMLAKLARYSGISTDTLAVWARGREIKSLDDYNTVVDGVRHLSTGCVGNTGTHYG